MRLNPRWQDQICEKIGDYERDGKPFDHIESLNMASQWIIARLASKNIAFKVIPLGAGVRRITTNVEICEKCNGTGKC